MLSYANSMTAPIIPPSAIQSGETDLQVTGLLVHIPHCSFRRLFIYFYIVSVLSTEKHEFEMIFSQNVCF
jgi:hypothetical protein